MTALDRAVLRSAVGEENFPDLQAICDRLDRLGCRLAISGDGFDRIVRVLAEELVAQRLAIDVASAALALPEGPGSPDTHTPEDPPA